jgi:V-type H+-transporting ATPase subunit d
MEYLTYAYMIDNVALLITGTLHERDTRELLDRCHPLGWFETMPALCVATNIEELYNSVLIETPLAPYFKGSLSHQDLDELNIEIVRNTLYKNYLEDFHRFVNEDKEIAGTPTQDVMSEILEFEADRRSINITINSFGTELTKTDRKKLYPNFGRLHPEGTLMLSRADDPEGVRIAVDGVSDYRSMLDQTGMGGGNQSSGIGNQSGGIGGDEGKSLEDLFYQREMEISKLAFTHQFTHSIVYAWLRLREQVRIIEIIVCCMGEDSFADSFFLGNPQHHLDLRVHCAKPEGQDWQLHLGVLETRGTFLWEWAFFNGVNLCFLGATTTTTRERGLYICV